MIRPMSRRITSVGRKRWASNAPHLTTAFQVHGNRVIVVGDSDRGRMLGEADGLITNVPGIPLDQRFADCTPILMYDPVQHAVGTAHAGWQGVVARVAEATVQAMQQAYGSDPADLVAELAPPSAPAATKSAPKLLRLSRPARPIPNACFHPARMLAKPTSTSGKPTPNNCEMLVSARSKWPNSAPPATKTSSSPTVVIRASPGDLVRLSCLKHGSW